MEKDRALWLVQGSPQYQVLLRTSHEETVILVPRKEWRDHHSFGVVVACHRPQGDGEMVHGAYLTLAAGVACDMLQEGGKWVYRRHRLRETSVSNAGRHTMEVSVLSGQNAAAEQRSMEVQPFGDFWIETVMRREHMEVTKGSRGR